MVIYHKYEDGKQVASAFIMASLVMSCLSPFVVARGCQVRIENEQNERVAARRAAYEKDRHERRHEINMNIAKSRVGVAYREAEDSVSCKTTGVTNIDGKIIKSCYGKDPVIIGDYVMRMKGR